MRAASGRPRIMNLRFGWAYIAPSSLLIVLLTLSATCDDYSACAFLPSSFTAKPIHGPPRRRLPRSLLTAEADGATSIIVPPPPPSSSPTSPSPSSSKRPSLIVEEWGGERRLDEYSTVVHAARATGVLVRFDDDDDGDDDDGSRRRSSCEGFLVRYDADNRYEACISCEGVVGVIDDLRDDEIALFDALIAVYHRLLLHYLKVERASYAEERDCGCIPRYRPKLTKLAIHFHDEDDIYESTRVRLMDRLADIGLLAPSSSTIRENDDDDPTKKNQVDDKNDDVFAYTYHLAIDLYMYVPFLNEYAFAHRGTDGAGVSLEVLRLLSTRRTTYDFDSSAIMDGTTEGHGSAVSTVAFDEEDGSHTSSPGVKGGRVGRRGRRRKNNVVSRLSRILPTRAIDDVMGVMEGIKSRHWLSDNPDSVDGLPSLHLNLIANGVPVFELERGHHYDDPDYDDDDDDGVSSDDESASFSDRISRMTNVLMPHLYDCLLPVVREVTNSSTVEISDVFLRHYGRGSEESSPLVRNDDDDDDRCADYGGDGADDDDDDEGKDDEGDDGVPPARFVLSPHYDVTAYATCVIALDSTASTGRSGLYVIPPPRTRPSSSSAYDVGHAALRQFIPLEMGDGVVHTYDVLHGVDVDPEFGLERTSLIVWFVDNDDGGRDDDDGRSGSGVASERTWLLNPVDDVGEFVLGLASESSVGVVGSGTTMPDPYSLYLSSARKGNVFGISALANMCDEGLVPAPQHGDILGILTRLNKGNLVGSNPFLMHSSDINDIDRSCKGLACALFWHAAIRGGHRSAQISLADEIMRCYHTKEVETVEDEVYTSLDDRRLCPRRSSREDALLAAGVLFTMAHDQGHAESRESLRRLMDIEIDRLIGDGDELFTSPVMRILLMTV